MLLCNMQCSLSVKSFIRRRNTVCGALHNDDTMIIEGFNGWFCHIVVEVMTSRGTILHTPIHSLDKCNSNVKPLQRPNPNGKGYSPEDHQKITRRSLEHVCIFFIYTECSISCLFILIYIIHKYLRFIQSIVSVST